MEQISIVHTTAGKIIIVVGSTGTGKSTIINMLYNNGITIEDCEGPLKTAPTAASVTTATTWRMSTQGDVYCDTVGFGDHTKDDCVLAYELKKFLRTCQCGVHCIIIVTKYGRLSHEERCNLKLIAELFDRRWRQNCIMVLTYYGGYCDEISRKNALESWLGEDDPEVQNFVQKIGRRVILTDNSLERHEEDNREIRLYCLEKLKAFIATCDTLVGPAPVDFIEICKLILEHMFLFYRLSNATEKVNNIMKYLLKQQHSLKFDLCCICLEEMSLITIARTNCSHAFHTHCIEKCLKNDAHCPRCHETVNTLNVMQFPTSEVKE